MNAQNLNKSQSVELQAAARGLKHLIVGAGWNPLNFDGQDPTDIDLSCFLLGRDGKTREDSDFIFYNNLEAAGGSVTHKGDNRSGVGEGDDEIIFLDLPNIPFEVASIVFVASIYDAGMKEQDFSMVKNAYIRVYNEDTREELIRYDMAEEFAGEIAVKIASFDRAGDEWTFTAIGEPIPRGLGTIATEYGILVVE